MTHWKVAIAILMYLSAQLIWQRAAVVGMLSMDDIWALATVYFAWYLIWALVWTAAAAIARRLAERRV